MCTYVLSGNNPSAQHAVAPVECGGLSGGNGGEGFVEADVQASVGEEGDGGAVELLAVAYPDVDVGAA